MTIASVAQDLYTIQSKKNVSFKAAASILLREELAARFSVYNIVKIVTKSTLLATIAQSKYGKGTPEQRKQLEQENEERKKSVLFQRYTLSSIANLNRRVGLLTSIVDRNNQLISNLYSELGSYRGGRRVTAQMLSNPRAVRVPSMKKTVKGKLDDLSAEIAELRKVRQVRRVYTTKKAKEQTKQVQESGLIDKIVPFLLSNPRLALTLMGGAAGTAIGLGTYAAQIGSLFGLSGGISRIKDRLQGKTGVDDPIMEQISRFIDPALLAVGGYTATRLGLGTTAIGANLYNSLQRRKIEKRLAQRQEAGKGRGIFTEERIRVGNRAQKIQQRSSKASMQLSKWKKLSPLLKGLGKRLPALAAADVLYEVGKMSGYVADHSIGKLNDKEFKDSMTGGYAQLISTIGIGGVSTALGGIVGTAVFPGLGTLGGLAAGGIVGAIASIALDDDLTGIASKVFDLIHADIAAKVSTSEGDYFAKTQPSVSTPGRGPSSRRGKISEYAKTQVAATPVFKTSRNLLEYVGNLESKGNYNAVNYTATAIGYPKSMDLTNKTLAEILALQAQMEGDGAKSTALGKYQFIQDTLKEEAGFMGLDLTKTKFDPATQDKIIEHRLNRFRGMQDYKNGRITARQFIKNLSMEFASIPDPDTGVSRYAGVAGNKSLVALNSVYAAIGARETEMNSAIRVAAVTPPLPTPEKDVAQPPTAAPTPPVAKTEDKDTAVEARAAALAVAQLSSVTTTIGSKVNQLERKAASSEASFYTRSPDSSLDDYRVA